MPPKVLTVSEIFWPEGGGAELATRLIVEQLSRAGCEVTVVTGTRKPEPVPGVEFHYTPLLKASNRLVRWGLMEALTQQRWFKELLKSHDVLYVPLAAYPLIPLAKNHGLRVVVHLHNYAPVRYSSLKYYFEPDALTLSQELKLALYHELHAHRNPARAALMPLSFALYKRSRAWIRQADTIICVSKRQAEIVAKSAPELADKIRVTYNPLPPELADLKLEKALDEVPTILYVSGDSHVKGFYIIPRVIHILDKKKVKIKFIIAGSYRQKNIRMLKNLTRKLNYLEVQILGKIDHSKIVELHKIAWALLFPSIIEEPLPYTVAESMALGTVPVASRAGGVLEMLESTHAAELTFQPGSIENIINRLEILASMNDSEVIALGNELREKVRSFSNVLVSNIITN